MSTRRIALFLDGTWNRPDNQTNVYILYQATQGIDARACLRQRDRAERYYRWFNTLFGAWLSIRPVEATAQWLDSRRNTLKTLLNHTEYRYYDMGVGSSTITSLLGGAIGWGLSKNITQAYLFLSRVYQPGDQIFIFGFSRGSYTARSLVGLIARFGLLASEHTSWTKAQRVVSTYKALNAAQQQLDAQDKANGDATKSYAQNWQRLRLKNDPAFLNALSIRSYLRPAPTNPASLYGRFVPEPVRIRFLGVWDTVGALGLPTLLVRTNQHNFHDTDLPDIVDRAYQALAIDEHRRKFQHTPWDSKHEQTEIAEQMWFVGAHGNVGGGYRDNYLNAIPRQWLQDCARQSGLKFYRPDTGHSSPLLERVEDSYRAFLLGLYARFSPRYYRPIQIGEERGVSTDLHSSVQQYLQAHRNYRPINLPANEHEQTAKTAQ